MMKTSEQVYDDLDRIMRETGHAGAILVMCGNPMTVPTLIVGGIGTDDARELLCRAIAQSYLAPTEHLERDPTIRIS